jgi:hypothetical protein
LSSHGVYIEKARRGFFITPKLKEVETRQAAEHIDDSKDLAVDSQEIFHLLERDATSS